MIQGDCWTVTMVHYAMEEEKVFWHSSAHAGELLYERLNKAGLDSKLIRELSILDVCRYTRRP